MKYSLLAKPYKNIYNHINVGNYSTALREIGKVPDRDEKKQLYSTLERQLMSDMWTMPLKKKNSASNLLEYIRSEIIKYSTITQGIEDIEKRLE